VTSRRSLLRAESSLSHSSAIVSVSLLAAALLGAGQALLLAFIEGEGSKTDAFLASYALYVVFTIRGGAVARQCYYPSHQDALEAVGLSEQDAQQSS
jgi:hypothetical protein